MIHRLKKSEFVRNSSWSFLAVVFRSMGGVVVSKLFSVFFGASGLAILSHFQNLMSFFTSFANEGVNKSVIKYWSDKKLSKQEKSGLFKTALWVTGIMMLVVLLPLAWWFKEYFFGVFLSLGTANGQFIWLFILGVALLTFAWCVNSFILVECSVKDYALINIFGLLLLVTSVFLGVRSGELTTALSFFVIGNGSMFIFSLFYLIYRRRELVKSFRGWPEKVALKRISRFLAMAVSVVLFGQVLDFVVRDYIIGKYGLDKTGEWQAVVKMSSNYLLLCTNVIGAVYYPKVSKLIYDHMALRKYVFKVMALMTLVSLLSLSIYYLNRGPFLRVFFDKELENAIYLVRYQAIGDFFAVNAFLLATILVAKVQMRKFIMGRVVSALVFVSALFFLLGKLGLEALTMGYMFRQIGLFLLLVFFNRSLLFGAVKSESNQSKVSS